MLPAFMAAESFWERRLLSGASRAAAERGNVDSDLDNICCITYSLCNYPWCKGKSCVNKLQTGEEETGRIGCSGEKPRVLGETVDRGGNGLLQNQPQVFHCWAFLW